MKSHALPTILAAGILAVSVHQAAAATTTVLPGAGTIKTNTLGIASGFVLDMTNNPLIVVTTPQPTIFGYASSGYNGFGWDGTTGILSTTAAADPLNFAYGIIDNNDGFANYGTWFGTPVALTDTLGRYTYSGDVNLNGEVDSFDYFLLDLNFGGAANYRMSGDLNYDNVLDSGDYFLIDLTFGTPALAAPFVGGLAAASGSVVPEPASAGLLALGALGLLARRRRSSH